MELLSQNYQKENKASKFSKTENEGNTSRKDVQDRDVQSTLQF